MSKQRIAMPFALAARLGPLPVSAGFAQMFRGRISGILTAEFKAAFAGANVTLPNVSLAYLAMLGSADEDER